MKILAAIILSIILTTEVLGTGAELALCQKDADAHLNVIYLPGVDGLQISKTEIDNRKILEQVSKGARVNIAVMRSQAKCPKRFPDSVCWPQGTSEEVESTIQSVLSLAASCFDKTKGTALLGFSNGGYLAGKHVQQCGKSPFQQVIAVGSAGAVTASQSDMSQCGKFTLMMGLSDKLTFHAAKEYYELLKKKNARVTFVTYEGGHTLTVKSLVGVLRP
ncbi:MAG: hypothetical protein AB7T49_07810 [Oligoflexales bacterium]